MPTSFIRASLSICLLLAAACGGRTAAELPGDDVGPGGDNTGPLDGGACRPLPGCTSTSVCAAGDGCNTCNCVGGAWACGDLGCGDDTTNACPPSAPQTSTCNSNGLVCDYGLDAGGCGGTSCYCKDNQWFCETPPCTEPACPAYPPSGESCQVEDQYCSYPTYDGCDGGDDCSCVNGVWSCYVYGCPPPSNCPSSAPAYGTQCGDAGNYCSYPQLVGSCTYETCDCSPSGTWECYEDCGVDE